MQRILVLLAGTICLGASALLQAGTLTVTTDKDERNCRSEAGCTTLPNSGGTNYPNSTGCSLREALDDIQAASNGLSQPYPECGTADPGPSPVLPGTFTNTIVLAAHTVDVNSQVPDPGIDLATNPACASMSPVKCPIQYGEMTHVGDSTASPGYGNLEITGGTITCTSSNMLHVNPSGDLTLAGTHFQNCTSGGSGVAVTDQNDASLTLLGVTFTNIHSTLDSVGGCIQHGSGNLIITGGAFTGCIADDGTTQLPYPFGGGTNGIGGAIAIGNVGTNQHVAISGVAFTGNVASLKGGAIAMQGTDAVVIDTSTFQGNLAFGDSTATPANGGGAINADHTAQGPIPSPPPAGFFASDFLLFQDHFIANIAVKGNGGAILLNNGGLTYGQGAVSLGLPGASLQGKVPGGIIASSFESNLAQGAANLPDKRSGAGGAIYADGSQLAILDSSFLLGNSSANAGGGAIAWMDATDAQPPLAVSNTTFNGNTASTNGGGIAIITSQFTGNGGKAALINDTFSGNTTTQVGGGGNFYNGSPNNTEVNVSNTIFVDGGPSGNCAGMPFTDVVGNLQFNPNAGCANMNAGDPKLKSPSIFSGPNVLVFTQDLNSGSAASRAGDPATCAASPIDNLDGAVNGRPNPNGTNCDIGAYEANLVPDLIVTSMHTDPFHQNDVGDTYTLTVSNPGSDASSGMVSVVDVLPAGVTATAIAGTNWSCTQPGGPCTRSDVLPGSGSFEAITLTVNVSGSAMSGVNVATVSGGGEVNTANDVANDPTTINAPLVINPPTIAKNFGAASLPLNGSTSLTFMLQNTNPAQALTGVAFSDTLPAGLAVATPNGLSGSCGGGTITATAGSSAVSLATATLPGNGSCTFSVNVTGIAAGMQNNITGNVTATESGPGGTANASVVVVAPPSIAKAFMPSVVAPNGTTTLTFTLTNPAANTVAETGVAFTDTLPAGLVIGTPSGLTNTCGGVPTAAAGTNSIMLTGASLAASSSCMLSVVVQAGASGQYLNVTGAVSSTNGGTGNTANANLTVAAVQTIAKNFGAATIPLNGQTSLTLTSNNPNAGVALSGLSFTDTLPAGLVVGTPNGLTSTCGGTATATAGSGSVSLSGGSLATSGSCTVTVNVQGTTAGVKNNSVQSTTTEAGTSNMAAASVTVIAPPTIAIGFNQSTIKQNATSTLTFTIDNPAANAVSLTGVAFTDSLPASVIVFTPNGLTNTCGGSATATAGSSTVTLSGVTLAANATCTVTVTVQGTMTGTQNNSVQVTSANGGAGNTAQATLTVNAMPVTLQDFSVD